MGLTTNRLLLAGLAFEVAFTAAVVYLPPPQAVFGTAALPGWVLVMMRWRVGLIHAHCPLGLRSKDLLAGTNASARVAPRCRMLAPPAV